MKLAVSNIAWAPDDRRAAYAILQEAGITGLEIAPGLFFHGAGDPFDPDPAVARAAMDEIAAAGLSLVSMQSLLFGVQGAALFGDAEALARFERGMQRAIALAGRLGIPNLVFGSPGQRVVPDGMEMVAARAHAADVLRRLGDAAQAAGTVIAVESNPAVYGTNFLNTFAEARAFVAGIDHPAVTVILDLGAMHLNGDFGTVPAAVIEAGARLSHVHVSEPHLAPAPADIAPARLVCDALERAGYDRAISIEMKAAGLDALAASVARLLAARTTGARA